MSASSGNEPSLPAAARPTETFNQRQKSLYLNDEGIQVIHEPAAHTDGDSIVFFRRSDVIVAGDIFDITRLPTINVDQGGSIQGEIDALNRLIALAVPSVPLPWKEGGTYIVPGHGRICEEAELVEYRDMVTIIRDRVQDMVNRGMNLAQIKAASPAQGYTRRYGSDTGSWTTSLFVEAVHRSLTEREALMRRRRKGADWSTGEILMATTKLSALLARHLSPLILAIGVCAGPDLYAQARGGQGAQAPSLSAKAAAPIDLSGYWVSIISEDWRWRMVTPAKGDYASIPITAAAKKVADAWDPAKDEAASEQCKPYGAAAIMRVPGRLRISWQDDNTLKVETDAGMQTRLLHFGRQAPAGQTTWQGDSVASWEVPRPGRGGGQASPSKFGHLKVVTTRMRPGYLRKNGVPYSGEAVLTEHWELHRAPNAQWLVVTSLVNDPQYLQGDFVTSSNFKKETDGSKWDPTPCSAVW